MKYIAYPIKLRFMANKEKHIAGVIERLENAPMNLVANVQACINNSYGLAVADLMKAVKSEYLATVVQFNKTTEFSDFELTYSIEEIKSNRVWAGGGTTQRKDFKN